MVKQQWSNDGSTPQAAALATAALVLRRKRATASTSTALRAVEPEVVDTEEGPVAELGREMKWDIYENSWAFLIIHNRYMIDTW